MDLRSGDGWFDPWLIQYSLQELMIVLVTGFIPLTAVHFFRQCLCGKAASVLERILWIDALASVT